MIKNPIWIYPCFRFHQASSALIFDFYHQGSYISYLCNLGWAFNDFYSLPWQHMVMVHPIVFLEISLVITLGHSIIKFWLFVHSFLSAYVIQSLIYRSVYFDEQSRICDLFWFVKDYAGIVILNKHF